MFHHEHMLYDTIDLPKTANKRLHVLKETLTPPHKTISNQRCFFLFFFTTQPPLSNEDVDYVTIYHSNPLQTVNYHSELSIIIWFVVFWKLVTLYLLYFITHQVVIELSVYALELLSEKCLFLKTNRGDEWWPVATHHETNNIISMI